MTKAVNARGGLRQQAAQRRNREICPLRRCKAVVRRTSRKRRECPLDAVVRVRGRAGGLPLHQYTIVLGASSPRRTKPERVAVPCRRGHWFRSNLSVTV